MAQNAELNSDELSSEDLEYAEMFAGLKIPFQMPDPDVARFHFAQSLSGSQHPAVLPLRELYWDDLTGVIK
jgi:hypothetical protein